MSKKPHFSLSAWLVLLVVGALVPLLIFATAMLAWMGKSGEAERDRALQDRARALALAVDREVAAWKTATGVLAASTALERGRLADFHAEAQRVGAQLGGWFSLCDATAQQLVNTLLPYGAPLPKSNPVVLEIFRDPRPVVRDPIIGSVAQRPVITVGMPVLWGGRVAYALNLGIDPARLGRLFEAQQLPATWVAGITDRQFKVIARSIHAEERLGKPAPQALQEAAAAADAGLVTHVMTDGRPGRTAFQRLTEVPWVLALAVPVSELPSPRPLVGFVLIGVLLGGIAAGAAGIVGRKIARPIRRLAHLAPTLVRGGSADADVASGIQEVRQLQQALVEAAEKAQAYSQERERTAEALRRANETLESRVQERTAALQQARSDLEQTNIRLEEANADLGQELKERERMEEALRRSREDLRALVELSPAVIARLDRQLRHTFVSPAVERILGRPPGFFLGKTMAEAGMAPEALHAWEEGARGVFAEGGEREVEFDFAGRTFSARLAPQRDASGAVESIISVARDITERKKRERELHRLNRTLVARRKSTTAMMRATSESEYLEEVCTIVVEDCGHAMVWIGFAEEDEAKTVRPVAHAGFEDGYLDTLAITWADTERGRGPTGTAIRTGTPSMCRNMLTDPRFAPWRAEALRRGYASSLVLPLLDNGKAFGAVTIYSKEPDPFSDDEVKLLAELADDLAYGIAAIRLRVAHARAEQALRQSEERYRALVDLSPDAIFINRDNRVIFLNPAALRLFGASAAAQILGKSPFDLYHPDSHVLVRTRIRQLLEGQAVPPIEEKIVRVDGTVVDVEVAASPFTDADGVAIQVILRDITERKRAEQALRQARDELEGRVQERTAALSQAVRQLEKQSVQLRALASELTLAEQRERRRVAEVLHGDLQQLLVGAKLVISSLAQATDPAVREAGREVTDLLLRALRCSRSLTEELSPPILHRGGLVPALEWLARWMEEMHRLTVIVRAEAAVGTDSHDTTILLFQSIRELLFNAAKHAQVHSASVEITERDDQVRVRVSDEGVGFDPAQQRVAGGTSGGFGLFGIRERLELLGGSLEIESAPGKGSRFTLWLPVHRAVAADRPATILAPGGTEPSPAAVQPAGPRPADIGARKIRVLVVDDHLVVRQGFVQLLTEEPDIEVVGEAADGQTAVVLTRRLSPDAVIMDVEMPGMNGIEATRLIHGEFPAVRVIGLSMFGEAVQAAAMREAGAVNYLTKSAPSDALVAAIRACGMPAREGEGR